MALRGCAQDYYLFSAAFKPENSPWNHLYLRVTTQGYTELPIFLRVMEGQVTLAQLKRSCYSISSTGEDFNTGKNRTLILRKRDSVFLVTLQ